jgi:hypothetical protein
MITDKQRQRDYEYEADYQSKSRYTTEQWTNILNSGQLDENNISLLKQIYSSFNHAATLLQGQDVPSLLQTLQEKIHDNIYKYLSNN